MPLVGGDMCPIAIDVVEKFQIISEPAAAEEESPLHYIGDHKESGEDLPIIEKYEHHEEDIFDNVYDHVIPIKGEHHDLEHDEYENPDHIIPEKTEHQTHDVHHLPKQHWTPDFHGPEEELRHHSSHSDGILEDYLHDDPDAAPKLKPKVPKKDDPRL